MSVTEVTSADESVDGRRQELDGIGLEAAYRAQRSVNQRQPVRSDGTYPPIW